MICSLFLYKKKRIKNTKSTPKLKFPTLSQPSKFKFKLKPIKKYPPPERAKDICHHK